MRILVTNHQLHEYTGSEVSTLTLCKYLQKNGNKVTVYSKFLSKELVEDFVENHIRVINDLGSIKDENFDIGHIQHNISAYEVRYIFPKLPLIMWIHGKYPYLEQPPFIDLNISYYLRTNNKGVQDLIKKGVQKNKIILLRNLVDSEIFKPKTKINEKIKIALILSNKLPEEKEIIIRNVLNNLNIKSIFIGNRFKIIKNKLLPNYINQADIVFTIGLGAMESMMCGRVPILFDYNFSNFEDGIVTPENFDELKECNFSGRYKKRIMTEQDLISDIKSYDYKNGDILQKKAKNEYDANKQIKKIVHIYKKTIKNFQYKPLSKFNKKILYNIIQIINTTNLYTKINILNTKNTLYQQDIYTLNQKLQNDLDKIQSSKVYKLWQRYNKIKRKLVRNI